MIALSSRHNPDEKLGTIPGAARNMKFSFRIGGACSLLILASLFDGALQNPMRSGYVMVTADHAVPAVAVGRRESVDMGGPDV
jgi:hypothetical protein